MQDPYPDTKVTGAWRWLWMVGLACVNIPLVWVYLGPLAAITYLVCYLALVIILWIQSPRIVKTRWLAPLVIAVSLAAQLLAIRFLSPRFELGMDRNEALTYWLSALFRGEYPYALRTNLGNPISVLPFMPALALPFTLLGNVGLLEVFSYGVIVALLWYYYRKQLTSRVFSVIVLSTAPVVFFEVIARSDILANITLYTSLLCLLVYLEEHNTSWTYREGILIGVFLALLAATRIAFWPMLIIPVVYLWRFMDRQVWLLMVTIATLLFLVFVVPFALWDPETFFKFAPIGVNSSKLGQSFISQLFWPALTMVFVLIAGLRAQRARDLFALTLPAIAVIVVATWVMFFFDLSYLQMIFVPMLFACEFRILRATGLATLQSRI